MDSTSEDGLLSHTFIGEDLGCERVTCRHGSDSLCVKGVVLKDAAEASRGWVLVQAHCSNFLRREVVESNLATYWRLNFKQEEAAWHSLRRRMRKLHQVFTPLAASLATYTIDFSLETLT